MKKKILDILYKDDDIVVVNKKPGLLSIPDRFKHDLPNVRDLLRKELQTEIFTVHRLDRETGGAMIFALNAEAHRTLSIQFEQQQVKKKYHAVVAGVMEEEELNIDIGLAPDPRKKGLMRPFAKGKESHTFVKVVERFRVATLVECMPTTGRQHQIRVHLSSVGYPLFVDKDYGTQDAFFVSSIKRRYKLAKRTEEKPLISTMPLHSRSLEILHPTSGKAEVFVAEYSREFSALLQVLRKYSKQTTFSIKDFVDF